MPSRGVLISLVLHVAVFGLALRISTSRANRKATTVAVVTKEKKKPEEKKKEQPKPKPMLASARPEMPRATAPAKAAPTPVHEAPAPAEAPVDTGLQMGNDDGPGISLGGPAPAAPKQNAPAQQQVAPREKVVTPKKERVVSQKPEEDECTEAPSKPVPAQRSEIEYTQEARANGVEGRLVLRITVGADGSVEKVEVVSSVDPSLDAAVIATVKTWTFKPSMRCGKAMAGGVFMLAKRFELSD
jgi:protein TonB